MDQRLLGSDSIHEMTRLPQGPSSVSPSPQGLVEGAGQGFESLSIYDAPGLLVNQVLNDVETFDSIKSTFLNPNSLSPRQRETLRQSIFGDQKEGFGKAVAGVLTNPWVWLYFVTTPVGSKALRQVGAGALFKQGKAWSAWLGKQVPPLASLLPAIESFPHASELAMEGGRHIERLSKKWRGLDSKAEFEFLNHWSKKGLKFHESDPFNPTRYLAGSKERDLMETFSYFESNANLMGHADAPLMDSVAEMKARVVARTRGGVTKAMDPGEVQRRLMGGQSRTGQAPTPSMSIVGAEASATGQLQRLHDQEGFKAWRELPSKFKKEWKEAGGTSESWVKEKWPDRLQFETEAWVESYEQPFLQINGKPRVLMGREEMLKAYHDTGGELSWQVIEGRRAARKQALIDHVGDENLYLATGEFAVDEDKVRSLVPRLRTALDSFKSPGDLKVALSSRVQGLEALYGLVGVDKMNLAIGLDDGGQTLVKTLKEAVSGGINETRWKKGAWMSRNVFDLVPVSSLDGKNRMLPLQDVDDLLKGNLGEVPHSSMKVAGKQIASVLDSEPVLHPDDLRGMQRLGLLAKGNEDLIGYFEEVAQKNYGQHGKATMGMRLSASTESHERALRHMAQSTVFDTMSALPRGESVGAPGAMAADEAWRHNWLTDPNRVVELEGRMTKIGVRDELRVTDSLQGRTDVTLGDLMERAYQRLPNARAQQMFRSVFVPGAMHTAGSHYLTTYLAHQRTKATAEWFVNSWIGKGIKKFGGEGGREFFQRMEQAADPFQRMELGSITNGMAQYLYVTHLGLNMGSVMLNLTQPFLLASTMAKPEEVLRAMGTTFKEFWKYGTERAKLGLREITAAERATLYKKSFKLADHYGDDLLHLTDQGVDYAELGLGGPEVQAWQRRSFKDKAFGFMMKPFEKSEQFNRVLTGNISKEMYRGAGLNPDDINIAPLFSTDTSRLVQTMQFAGTALNSPMIFSGNMGGSVLSNPLLRMFTTFPLRMATTAFYTMPRLAGSNDAWKQGLNLFLRGMGTSAFLYEVGKGMMGADLSRGLYLSSVTDIVGGGRLSQERGSPLPIPPVIQIPWDLMSGVVREDSQMLASALSRMVPGGVAMFRAMNALPSLPVVGSQSMGLQRTSVGWHQVTPEGMVPVYRSDGALIEWRPRSEVIAKALGVDMGAWQKQGALDGYLVKQREKFVEARHDFMRAVGANDIAKARRIQTTFERTHGVPLTIGAPQIKAYLQSQSTTRTQRTLNTFPSEVRPAYQQMAYATPGVTQTKQPISDPQILEMQRRIRELQSVGPAARSIAPFAPFTPQ